MLWIGLVEKGDAKELIWDYGGGRCGLETGSSYVGRWEKDVEKGEIQSVTIEGE